MFSQLNRPSCLPICGSPLSPDAPQPSCEAAQARADATHQQLAVFGQRLGEKAHDDGATSFARVIRNR